MKYISKELREAMEESTLFYPTAKITFADGRTKDIGEGDFNISGNSITDSAYSDSFPLGIMASKQITLSLINDEDQWSEYDFFGAKIFLQTKYKLNSGLIETFNIGTFTVITPETYGTTVEFTAMDDGYKTDKEYFTKLSYPLSLGVALRDSCQTCSVTLLTGTFPNDNYVILQAPTDLTHRQFIGMCAMIAGGNARFDEYNRLMIMPYDFSYFERHGLDGGYFDGSTPYASGDTADGGSFVPWNIGDTADGGAFGDRADIHVLYEFKSGMRVGVDDVVITGVQITDEDKEVHLYGKEGYVLDLSNQLALGKEEQVVQLIGQKIVGLRFRPFDVDHIAYPIAEFMDLAYIIDRKQNVYQTVITDVTFNYYGYTTLKCNANSPIRNSSTYYGNETKAIVESRKLIQQEKTEREKAIENLADQLAKSSGLYITEQKQLDGSTIYYMHDKKTLAESMIVWKMTAQAFGISTDGGKTYPYGLDASGVAILNEIYTIGLNADYINSGTMIADRIMGGTLTLGGVNNTNGQMDILSSTGTVVGNINNDGIVLNRGNIALSNRFKVSSIGECYAVWPHFVSGIYLAQNVSLNINDANYEFFAGYTGNQLWIGKTDGTIWAPQLYPSRIYCYGDITATGDIFALGNISCTGTKNRKVITKDYSERLLYCYEMPSPMFGDIGEGITDENGECCIYLDDIFLETISSGIEYQVFLQKEGPGDIWISKKESNYFLVQGTKNLKFAWEVKAKQKDYEYERLEKPIETEKTMSYETLYDKEYQQILQEREVTIYETVEQFYGYER